jgi:hypothetical protein
MFVGSVPSRGAFGCEVSGRARHNTARLAPQPQKLDCGGKRSPTPHWEPSPDSESGVAAALCHRTPYLWCFELSHRFSWDIRCHFKAVLARVLRLLRVRRICLGR